MATRIALYEAGAEAHFVEVDTKAKRTRDGADYWAINPLGLVPVIRTDDGELLTENAAILQYVADRYPAAPLAPPAGMDRSRLQQGLAFIGTELHKTLCVTGLDAKAPEVVKTYALEKGERAMAYLNDYLSGREYLLDRFSVADAYLFTVLNWSTAASVDLARWPAVRDYYSRMRQRPCIGKALGEESALYVDHPARRNAARRTPAPASPLGPPSPSWRCAAVSASAAPARRRRRQPAPRLDQELVAAQNSLLQRDRAPLTSSHRPFARVSGTRPQYSRQAVRTRRRGDRINLLQCKCGLWADFVAEAAEEESGPGRRAKSLACHSPVRAVAGDYCSDCQRAFGVT